MSQQERMQVSIVGVVQGVGFRPFVFRLAEELKLGGWVRNDESGVTIEVRGTAERLAEFLARLQKDKPPPAILYTVDHRFLPPGQGSGPEPPGNGSKTERAAFEIRQSTHSGKPKVWVLPDLAICADCRRELLDCDDRRHGYPFINCTHCGPRFTIIKGLPYDRPKTSMRRFEMCEACLREYEDPQDRRFHAQPNACPECGPQVELLDVEGQVLARKSEALEAAVQAVVRGRILALKGLGGFHLVADAGNESAVAELRRRKGRPYKPFALMYPSLEAVQAHVEVPSWAETLLQSSQSPILLLRRRLASHPDCTDSPAPTSGDPSSPGKEEGQGTEALRGPVLDAVRAPNTAGGPGPPGRERLDAIAPSVAPDSPDLGVFLPYTPLHVLLLERLARPVVATSGNLSDEPIEHRNEEAVQRLGKLCDLLLVHDRPIVRPADDSVLHVLTRPRLKPQMLRRSRGYAPLPLLASRDLPPILALGGHLNSAFALSRGREIIVSQYLGDLDAWESRQLFQRTVDDFLSLYDIRPQAVVHDLHPDYFTTQLARQLAIEWDVPTAGVQHHHAHLAACLAENEVEGPTLGLTWDGTGYGTDHTIWGGEFLLGDARSFKRVATLHPFRLAGGEKAVKQPWRVALSLLQETYGDDLPLDLPFLSSIPKDFQQGVLQILTCRINSPVTTSMGRLFDGVSALLDISLENTHQAQSAQRLESAAWRASGAHTGLDADTNRPFDSVPEPFSPFPSAPILEGAPLRLDWRPWIRHVVTSLKSGIPTDTLAADFHRALLRDSLALCLRFDTPHIALSGGVFCNRFLTEGFLASLEAHSRTPLIHTQFPPTDGNLAIGQLWSLVRRWPVS
ncbi:MAG TPA: carbamoyltransferase HypF [Acidobacteriota bacterium]|nr:carbamoyltransferase HypF [Acidobacteriota bacterium]